MNNNDTVYEFDVNLICDFFLHTDRQGPGSPSSTIKALSFVDNLNDESQIADIGCGTGGQTLTLAQNTTGTITALDAFPGFIDKLNLNVERMNLQNRIKGVTGFMESLPFQRESLDLIWSEGAIYNIGFERGINEWRAFLKPGGYVVVSESCWLAHYYLPMADAQTHFLHTHKGDKAAERFVEYLHIEESLYRRYKEYYGYVFFIGKKV